MFLFVFSACNKPQYGPQYRRWMKNKKGKDEVLKAAPANMVYVPGGKFVMGNTDDVIVGSKNTLARVEEVKPFFIDQTEVTNAAYGAYLNWLQKKGDDPLDYQFALPDTQCWHRPMSYNEPLVRNYLRHASFKHYPVVGVSWIQASLYCEWRSARINELDSMGEDSVEIRLPSEHEWEYASLANYSYNETNLTNDRTFSIRQKLGFGRGKMMHNFKRGRGDNSGLAHRPNDAANIPSPVFMYELNDYGLFNMHGNVAEWVGDAYVPVTIEDIMEKQNPNSEMYTDSMKKDQNFITPDETFARIMDSLGINEVDETEIETDITGAILRVYKGASWSDRAYYLNPGARRYLPQNAGTDYIGFRCASPIPEDLQGEQRDDAELPTSDSTATDSTKKEIRQAEKARQKALQEGEAEGGEDGVEGADKKKKKGKQPEGEPEEELTDKEKEKAAKAKEKEKAKKQKEKEKKAKEDQPNEGTPPEDKPSTDDKAKEKARLKEEKAKAKEKAKREKEKAKADKAKEKEAKKKAKEKKKETPPDEDE